MASVENVLKEASKVLTDRSLVLVKVRLKKEGKWGTMAHP